MRSTILVALAVFVAAPSVASPHVIRHPRHYGTVEVETALGLITFRYDVETQLVDLPGQDEALKLPEPLYISSSTLNKSRDGLLCHIWSRKEIGSDYHSTLKLSLTPSGEWKAQHIFSLEKLKGETKADAWIEVIAEYDSKTGRAVVGVARYEPASDGGVSVRRGWELWDTKKDKKIRDFTKPVGLTLQKALAPKLPKPKKPDKTKKSEQGGARQPATAPDSKSEGNEKPKPESEGRSQ